MQCNEMLFKAAIKPLYSRGQRDNDGLFSPPVFEDFVTDHSCFAFHLHYNRHTEPCPKKLHKLLKHI